MRYRLDHVHLKAGDVEETVGWYRQVLGARVVRRCEFRGSTEVWLDVGGGSVAVHGQLSDELALPAALHPRFGVDHFAVAVDDLSAALSELQREGVVVIEPLWEPEPGLRMACVAAPDKVRLEIVERRGADTADDASKRE